MGFSYVARRPATAGVVAGAALHHPSAQFLPRCSVCVDPVYETNSSEIGSAGEEQQRAKGISMSDPGGSDFHRKKAELEAKRASWMRQREIAEERLRYSRSHSSSSSRTECEDVEHMEPNVRSEARPASPAADDDLLLDRLTTRIEGRLRTELSRQLSRQKQRNLEEVEHDPESVQKHVDEYLNEVIERHQCPICYEVMNDPMILVPCGHTFCGTCSRQLATKGRGTCPYCRTKVQSSAPNLDLRRVVQTYNESREKLKTGEMRVSDMVSANSANSGLSTASSSTGYREQYDSVCFRLRVYENELKDLQEEEKTASIEKLAVQRLQQRAAVDVEEIDRQIRSLQDKKHLAEVTLLECKEQLSSMAGESKQRDKKIEIVRNTLANMQMEKDKCALIFESLEGRPPTPDE